MTKHYTTYIDSEFSLCWRIMRYRTHICIEMITGIFKKGTVFWSYVEKTSGLFETVLTNCLEYLQGGQALDNKHEGLRVRTGEVIYELTYTDRNYPTYSDRQAWANSVAQHPTPFSTRETTFMTFCLLTLTSNSFWNGIYFKKTKQKSIRSKGEKCLSGWLKKIPLQKGGKQLTDLPPRKCMNSC